MGTVGKDVWLIRTVGKDGVALHAVSSKAESVAWASWHRNASAFGSGTYRFPNAQAARVTTLLGVLADHGLTVWVGSPQEFLDTVALERSTGARECVWGIGTPDCTTYHGGVCCTK